MGLVVQKFGGTSLSSPSARKTAVNNIIAAIKGGNKVVVVVSAMGRLGEPYATDTFISLLETIDTRVDARKKDLLLSCGEIISAVVLSHLLDSSGIDAMPLTGFQAGIVTDGNYSEASIINIKTERVLNCLAEDKVAVIAGFQGYSNDLEITTLGRGGSDTTAITIGGYLGADVVDIFTDVPGVAVTNPKIIPEAPFMRRLGRLYMYHLAKHGASVVHPRAVKAAIEFGIPFRVRSAFLQDTGTLIAGETDCLSNSGLIGMACEEKKNLVSLVFDKPDARVAEKEVCTILSDRGISPLEVLYEPYTMTIVLKRQYFCTAIRTIYSSFFPGLEKEDRDTAG